MSYLGFSRHGSVCSLLCLTLLGVFGGGGSCAAKQPAKTVVVSKVGPEKLLSDIYKELSQHNLRLSQKKADALVAAYPNFHLGHLVRGDILLMHTRVVTTFGAAAPQGADIQLADLRSEAAVRMRAESGRPSSALVPRALLQLRKDQKHALIVDAKHSRLYLYENRDGQIRLLSDIYISQGKLGINKLKEGDMRTPVGVYYITARLPGGKLPDMYGKGALPLDYPNDWDKIQGRGGSGIWVHGTSAASFSRPPRSTDGCVVVSNDDLIMLARTVEIGKTPVLIGDQVEFVSKEQMESDLRVASSLVDAWRRDVENRDDVSLRARYSPRFKSAANYDVNTWLAKNQFLPGVKKISVAISDSSYFRQPSQEEVIVSNFTQQIVVGKLRRVVRKRQYWVKEGKSWKIVAESNV